MYVMLIIIINLRVGNLIELNYVYVVCLESRILSCYVVNLSLLLAMTDQDNYELQCRNMSCTCLKVKEYGNFFLLLIYIALYRLFYGGVCREAQACYRVA